MYIDARVAVTGVINGTDLVFRDQFPGGRHPVDLAKSLLSKYKKRRKTTRIVRITLKEVNNGV